ncbi:nitrate ABC transporter substrate-binding protein [Ectothiorhodosinus mongolicus]|nr:nitrate ABC transporter substrate-binding protein [Ectothiorhodosinus mongolicus]
MALPVQVNAQQLERVTASWLPIMQTMAFYVALEEGLFEKAGIDINPVRFQNPNQIIDSLVSGQADFGPPGAAAGITVLAESRFPGTFKVFGLQGGSIKYGFDNDALIVGTNSEIQNFADLRGKSIGTIPGVQWRTITSHILRQNGLEPGRDVRLSEIAVPQQFAAVASGAVDATLSLEPVGSITDNSDDVRKAMNNPVAQFISDPFYSGAAILTTDFIRNRPEVARRVVEVLDEATRLANENFDHYRPIIAKYTAVRPEQAEFVAQPYLRAWSELNDEDLNSYQAFVDVFHSEGVLSERMDIRNLILTPEDFQ